MFPRPQNFAGWPAAFIGVFIAAAAAQSLPVGAGAVDLSSPRSALLSLDRSLEAGDIAAAKKCLAFSGDAQARNFDIAYTQLYAPLALMHAVQARFGTPRRESRFGLAAARKIAGRSFGQGSEPRKSASPAIPRPSPIGPASIPVRRPSSQASHFRSKMATGKSPPGRS